ncbi:anthocyanidin 3-O-glucosyltransferase UFGT-like [Telopea speciosissima]|uniref:anthocyanidin 3-O-glucosyltransferase UFGT-like n=1 Tax=Telopea speciosissima TaxID=54955 RepID=UPI001CC52FC2|nr:anthocyanidin 3-O-glucosyltransferase UFGT-like [Telopea speciosissima]
MDETFHAGNSNNAPHIASLSFPFASHPMPLFMLACRLLIAAPDVMFSFFGTATSNGQIFKNINKCLENLKAYDVDDGIPKNNVFTSTIQEQMELFMAVTPWNFKKGIEVAMLERRRKITCLMSDAFYWFCGDIAVEIGIPWIAASLAGDCSLTTHVYTNLIHSTIGVGPNGNYNQLD